MTERLARISARRPVLTIVLWLVVALVGGALSQQLLDSATTTELRLGGGAESQRAANLLEDRLRGPKPVTEWVIVQSESATVDDPAFRERVESLYEEIIALGPEQITLGQHYYQLNNEALVSQDRTATIVALVMAGDLGQAEGNIKNVLAIVEDADDASSDFTVLMVGSASISYDQNELARHDLEQGERVGVPVALLILLVLFGTVVAALLPIGLSVICIVAALGLAALIGQAFELVFFVTLMITMIGLAVGIDYSLLIVSPVQGRDGPGPGQVRGHGQGGRDGRPHGAVQRHDRCHRPVRNVPCPLPVLPVSCPGSHPRRAGGHGRHPHPSAGRAWADGAKGQPSAGALLWQGQG